MERVVGDDRTTYAQCGRERTAAAFEGLLGDADFVSIRMTPLDGDALVAIESKEDK